MIAIFGLARFKTKISKAIGSSEYIRSAIEEKADLSAFKDRPTLRTIYGLILMGLSYIICWPAIFMASIILTHMNKPLWIPVCGGLLYGLSHLVFSVGMILVGAQYAVIFCKWATRVAVERFFPEYKEVE